MASRDDDALSMWTIYDHPLDYPQGFIARRWLITRDPEPFPTADTRTAADLETLRDAFEFQGLMCIMARATDDDPCIVETWI